MEEVRRAAEDYVAARERLEQAIRDAREEGHSNRAIADATAPLSWSYEQIRKIVGPRMMRL